MSFLSDPYDPCAFLVGGVGVAGDIVFLIPLLSHACNNMPYTRHFTALELKNEYYLHTINYPGRIR